MRPEHVTAGQPRLTVAEAKAVVDAAHTWSFVDFGELWRYRDLLLIFALRYLKVRYRQAVIGAAWAILQPITAVIIFSVFFGLLGKKPATGEVPYIVTAYCGLIAWQLFATSVALSSNSLVDNRHIITKIYFPRIILPTAATLCAVVDFAFAFLLLVCMMAWFGIVPGAGVVLLPVLILLATLTALGAGLWFSALNALYRDFVYVVPFVVQVGFLTSPVVYETQALVPERWQLLYALNPLVGILEGFRWALLGSEAPRFGLLVATSLGTALLLVTGMVFFRRTEYIIADRI